MPSKEYLKRLQQKTYKRNEREMLTKDKRKATKDDGCNGKKASKGDNIHNGEGSSAEKKRKTTSDGGSNGKRERKGNNIYNDGSSSAENKTKTTTDGGRDGKRAREGNKIHNDEGSSAEKKRKTTIDGGRNGKRARKGDNKRHNYGGRTTENKRKTTKQDDNNGIWSDKMMTAGKDFHFSLQQITWFDCDCCKERKLTQKPSRHNTCPQCKGGQSLLSEENDMVPGKAPLVLTRLTPTKKSAISIICPCVTVYKNGLTSSSTKGNCISYFQDVNEMATTLPRLPSHLPIIAIKASHMSITNKDFRVNRQHLIDALMFLKENSDDYANIHISLATLANAATYPEDGILQEVPQIDESTVHGDALTAENPDSATRAASTVDLPVPLHTIRENMEEVFRDVANVQWPKRDKDPASEFQTGYFCKAFPDLFPFGKGDITKARLKKNPSLRAYFAHLLQVDRRFASHHSFVFVATNMLRRHMALPHGNVFAKRSAEGLTVEALTFALQSDDDRIIKKLLYFASPIPGTMQSLRFKADKATSFVKYVRIATDDHEMFTFFQTFSAADLHWDDLHRLLPASDAYLHKIIIGSMDDLPDGADPHLYIERSTDFHLRTRALRDNADIVDAYFMLRIETLLATVLKSYGVVNSIVRYEVQCRGTMHAHLLLQINNGPSLSTMEKAYSVNSGDSEVEEAQREIIEYATNVLGLSATHPNENPKQWPGPYGANVNQPPTNCLTRRFLDMDGPSSYKEQYEKLVNRVMLHRCRKGYCLTDKHKDKEGTLICRFRCPFHYHGYEPLFDELGENLEQVIRTTQPPGGASFSDGKLTFVRNHPTIVHHVPQLLVIWGANIEGRPVQSYKQVLDYLLKYMFKEEPNSAPFAALCQTVIDKASDDDPVRKIFQQMLMKSIGEHDLSTQECFHILNGNDFVQFSMKIVSVNIMGTRRVQATESGNSIGDNVASIYWSRETDENFHELCNKFSDRVLYDNPREVTLFTFASMYSKKWKLTGVKKVPHFIPNFTNIPKRSGKHEQRYILFLRAILLAYKAGTTLLDMEVLSK